MSENRLKIVLYQYILNKGAIYNHNAIYSMDKLKRGKIPLQSDELFYIYRDLLLCELFEDIQKDICSLLQFYD